MHGALAPFAQLVEQSFHLGYPETGHDGSADLFARRIGDLGKENTKETDPFNR